MADPFILHLAEDDPDHGQTGSLPDGHIANGIPAIQAYRLGSQHREPISKHIAPNVHDSTANIATAKKREDVPLSLQVEQENEEDCRSLVKLNPHPPGTPDRNREEFRL